METAAEGDGMALTVTVTAKQVLLLALLGLVVTSTFEAATPPEGVVLVEVLDVPLNLLQTTETESKREPNLEMHKIFSTHSKFLGSTAPLTFLLVSLVWPSSRKLGASAQRVKGLLSLRYCSISSLYSSADDVQCLKAGGSGGLA